MGRPARGGRKNRACERAAACVHEAPTRQSEKKLARFEAEVKPAWAVGGVGPISGRGGEAPASRPRIRQGRHERRAVLSRRDSCQLETSGTRSACRPRAPSAGSWISATSTRHRGLRPRRAGCPFGPFADFGGRRLRGRRGPGHARGGGTKATKPATGMKPRRNWRITSESRLATSIDHPCHRAFGGIRPQRMHAPLGSAFALPEVGMSCCAGHSLDLTPSSTALSLPEHTLPAARWFCFAWRQCSRSETNALRRFPRRQTTVEQPPPTIPRRKGSAYHATTGQAVRQDAIRDAPSATTRATPLARTLPERVQVPVRGHKLAGGRRVATSTASAASRPMRKLGPDTSCTGRPVVLARAAARLCVGSSGRELLGTKRSTDNRPAATARKAHLCAPLRSDGRRLFMRLAVAMSGLDVRLGGWVVRPWPWRSVSLIRALRQERGGRTAIAVRTSAAASHEIGERALRTSR